MKVAVHIFSIYLIALSLVPCGDGGGGIVETARHFLEIEHSPVTDHEQHSNDCNDDACSPFCICSCCTTALHTPVKNTLYVAAPLPIPEAALFTNNDPLFSSFPSAIWQPPRHS